MNKIKIKKKEERGTERFSNLPKATQLKSGKANRQGGMWSALFPCAQPPQYKQTHGTGKSRSL
jgi:hypothetical protein